MWQPGMRSYLYGGIFWVYYGYHPQAEGLAWAEAFGPVVNLNGATLAKPANLQ